MFKTLSQKLASANAKLERMINRKASRRLIAQQIILVERLEGLLEQELMQTPMSGVGSFYGYGKHSRNERIRGREELPVDRLAQFILNPLNQNPQVWVKGNKLSQSEWEVKTDLSLDLPQLRGTESQVNWAWTERYYRLLSLPVASLGDFLEFNQTVLSKWAGFWLDTRYLSPTDFVAKMNTCLREGTHAFAHECQRINPSQRIG